ncbi:MAG: hypothetical protein HYR63_01265 [Proteobacteria bacterium]|nr:hypothetical protein [Pseudomonadota bacterium]
MAAPWWSEPVRFFQHLLREEDADGLDPERLIAEARSVGAAAYIVMGGGFSAWYPTALSSQRVNPHLRGDFLAAVTTAARRAGVKTILRMDISKGRPEWLERNPDWFTRTPTGAPNLIWEMPQTCATGPYWQVENFAILEELLEGYEFDGLFYNYLNVGRCYCARCQEIVATATGADIPAPGRREPLYETWRQSYLASYVRKLKACVHERNPAAVVIPYHHVRDGWRYRSMADAGDLVSAQVSNPLVVNPVDPQPQWNHWAAEEALAARAVKPGAAPVLIQTGSAFFASRQTAMPAGRIVRNLIQAAAHGASTAPAVNGTLQQDDPRAVPALRRLGRYFESNASWYRGLRSVARIALIRSQDSLDWGADQGRPAGDPGRPGHVAEFRGLYEMLVRRRYPCDVIPDGGLRPGDFERHAAVILPAVSCLGGEDAAVLDEWVAGGGCLIATADTGGAAADGTPRRVPALACLPSLPGRSRSIFGGYFEVSDPTLRARLGGIPHIGADGELWTGAPESTAASELRLLGPFRNNAPEFALVRGPATDPGFMRFRHGRGSAVWLPWRIGALFHFHGIPDYADLLGYVLEPTVGPPPIRSDASDAVEFILYGHPLGEVLHILNGAANQTKALVETTPIAGFTIRVRSKANAATLLNDGTPLPLERDGEDAVLGLDRLETFAAIALT